MHYELEAFEFNLNSTVYCAEIAVVALGVTVLLGEHGDGILLFLFVPSSHRGARGKGKERER